ncbi:EPIDERMAL PATTERNING FACTOR-like protein 8 [Neltuma alba]|uniref:EPIDERMAL PATTERNING FACTOR-like protein 8 n=1 Tax=Neltuma alba TaxID=207710 RepID=UPI0010A46EA2|nr:EPIDERMAL PATTERNING FACTOR-like protein 8 [Prosopis alba]
MGSPKTHPKGLNLKKTTSVILILILIISLTLLFPSNSDGSDSAEDIKQKKLALGSRPPGCFNKCFGCNPCRATLVISSRHKSDMAPSVRQKDHEGYYLLSWKCKCGNKLFEP